MPSGIPRSRVDPGWVAGAFAGDGCRAADVLRGAPVPVYGGPERMGRPRASHVPSRALEALVESGLLRRKPRNTTTKTVYLPLFFVNKHTGDESQPCSLRVILDGRSLNARLPDPPPGIFPTVLRVALALFPPPGVESMLSDASYAAVGDFQGWFYQIAPPRLVLSSSGEDIQIGVRVRADGGPSQFFLYTALPMGVNLAPSVAQHLSERIVHGPPSFPDAGWSLICIDDFAVFGASLQECEERECRVLERAKAAGAKVASHKRQPPSTSPTFIGVEWGLEGERRGHLRVKGDWARKWVTYMESILQYRVIRRVDVWAVLGGMSWYLQTTQGCWSLSFPLSFLVLCAEGRRGMDPAEEDVPFELKEDLANEWRTFSLFLSVSRWKKWRTTPPVLPHSAYPSFPAFKNKKHVLLAVDASPTGWGVCAFWSFGSGES